MEISKTILISQTRTAHGGYKWNPDGVDVTNREGYVNLLRLKYGSKLVVDPEQEPGKHNTHLNARRLRVGSNGVTMESPQVDQPTASTTQP